jgi:aldehyde dehydrogenase (NAD+)
MNDAVALKLDPDRPGVASTPQGSDGLYRYRLYIDGAFVDPAQDDWIETTDPVSGLTWARIPRGRAEDADRAVLAAHRAFTSGAWPALSPSRRGALLRKLGDLIADNAEWLARVEMKDNGKLYAELIMQMRYMSSYYYYYGGLADKMEGSVIPSDKPGVFNYTKYEPVGVVVCIMPWNSPLPLMSLKLAPALAAGNTVVLKPSEFTSASLLEFVKLVEAAGFPTGVVNVVTGYGQEVGDALISHPRVDRIAFTGGPEAGRIINEKAARHMKRVTMELGGKSPNIVFDDADLDQAVKGVVAGIFAASGNRASQGRGSSCKARSTTNSSRACSRSSRTRALAILRIPPRRSPPFPRCPSWRKSRRTWKSRRPTARAWSRAATRSPCRDGRMASSSSRPSSSTLTTGCALRRKKCSARFSR